MILLVGESAELTSAVAAGLTEEGYRFRQILPGTSFRQVSGSVLTADLQCAESLAELRAHLLKSGDDTVGAIINFLGVSTPFIGKAAPNAELAQQVCLSSFGVLKQFADDLVAAAAQGGGWVLNLTGLDGQFGLSSETSIPRTLSSAGLCGLFKAFRQEYPQVSVRNIDVNLAMPGPLLAGRVIEELTVDDAAYEVGLTAGHRYTLQLSRSTPHSSQLNELPLDAESVVLITGGAYGITCDIAQQLAEKSRGRLILVGRSPLPDPEIGETAGLDATGLRRLLITQARETGAMRTPAQLEQQVQRILKDRQILRNLAELEASGATVEYHSLDVRDRDAFGGLIDDLYNRYGRIDGVIHGAGVIEDKRIADKSPESFAKVFSTKVDSACVLAERLRPEQLRFLVFFSSVSGRFGNNGQSDYGAANEFLNKLASDLDRRWPGRVVAVNWGAWDAGMVSDELRKIYASRQIHLIPVADGVRFLEQELRLGGHREPEVTIGCSVPQLARMVAER